jgi:hypothetical protein
VNCFAPSAVAVWRSKTTWFYFIFINDLNRVAVIINDCDFAITTIVASIVIVREKRFRYIMGAIYMSESLMMFIKELALVVGDQISGPWNLSRSNTVRYQAESQVTSMMRRRIAGNMARAFANHTEQSLRLIGLCNPNKNKPNHFVPVVDRNSIHGSSNMSDIIDEEPLNSLDFAHQRPSNRWRSHMRG